VRNSRLKRRTIVWHLNLEDGKVQMSTEVTVMANTFANTNQRNGALQPRGVVLQPEEVVAQIAKTRSQFPPEIYTDEYAKRVLDDNTLALLLCGPGRCLSFRSEWRGDSGRWRCRDRRIGHGQKPGRDADLYHQRAVINTERGCLASLYPSFIAFFSPAAISSFVQRSNWFLEKI
jgi:hypothetical protein